MTTKHKTPKNMGVQTKAKKKLAKTGNHKKQISKDGSELMIKQSDLLENTLLKGKGYSYQSSYHSMPYAKALLA